VAPKNLNPRLSGVEVRLQAEDKSKGTLVSQPKTGSLRKLLGISALVAFVAGVAAKLRRGSSEAGDGTVNTERD
jgi:hypothetical protein